MIQRTLLSPEASGGAAARPVRNSRYEVPSAAQKELGLWVNGAGYTSSQQPAAKPWRRVLGSYAGVYVSRGHGWFHSEPTGKVDVKPGHLFWLFPTIEHAYSPNLGNTWAEQWVIFDGPVAQAFERHGFMLPANPFVQVGDNPEVAGLFGRLEDAFLRSGPLAVPLASAITSQIIVVVHGLANGFFTNEGGRGDPVVAEALRIIEQEAASGLDPESLADRLHVGYSTLRRRFKGKTGYAVKEYILRVQLKKAKELLAFTQMPVEQVAAESGFVDPFYFSRLFREREGVPPTAFRDYQSRLT
jgi:AraC family transcriptional regulator, arabinose operon regulatory protein